MSYPNQNPEADRRRRESRKDPSRLVRALDDLTEERVAQLIADAPLEQFVWGLPGTGKTTHLMGVIDDELEAGVDPLDIAGVTFRRSMAQELATEVAKKPEIEVELFPDDPNEEPPDHWFRTTHSACYKLLGLTPDSVVTEERRRAFCDDFGVDYELSGTVSGDAAGYTTETGFAIGGNAIGNQMFQLRSHALNTLNDPVDVWKRSPMTTFDIRDHVASRPSFVEDFNRDYESWKAREGLVDYDDMLLDVLSSGLVPPVEVLIEDEFQDKTLLQLAIFAQWADEVDRTYVAGDEKQALYSFLGAEPRVFEHMRERADERGVLKVLDTTYRVHENIWQYAESIFNAGALPVRITPHNDGGTVRSISFAEYENDVTDTEDVDTLHLVRTNHLGADVIAELDEAAVPYESPGGQGAAAGEQRAIYETVAAAYTAVDDARDEFGTFGFELAPEHTTRLIPLLPADWFDGTKTAAKKAAEKADGEIDLTDYVSVKGLNRLVEADTPFDELVNSQVSRSPEVRDRLRTMWKTLGAKAFDDVKHTVTTIHGAKGMEADRVYLHDRSTKRIQQNGLESRAARLEEQRVWFVGATRAKRELVIVEHESARHTHDLPNPRVVRRFASN